MTLLHFRTLCFLVFQTSRPSFTLSHFRTFTFLLFQTSIFIFTLLHFRTFTFLPIQTSSFTFTPLHFQTTYFYTLLCLPLLLRSRGRPKASVQTTHGTSRQVASERTKRHEKSNSESNRKLSHSRNITGKMWGKTPKSQLENSHLHLHPKEVHDAISLGDIFPDRLTDTVFPATG